MTTQTIVAALHAVTKSFGDALALDHVSLQVPAGQSLGLLGPNGAGKSTLISLLTGIRRPDTGHVRLFGADPTDPASRRRLGMTPQSTGVPQALRVREVFDFVGSHFADPMPAAELIDSFGLADSASKQCGALSGGQQRKLLVALALIGRPELVVLDEPTTGLDVAARESLWQALRDYRARGGTLLITSHYLAEIEALAERVVVVDHGKVIADGSVSEMTGRVALRRVSVTTTASPDQLFALEGVIDVGMEGDRRVLAARDADATVRDLVAQGIPFRDLEVRGASLEEAFLVLTDDTTEARA